jgi:hypothetical protein
MYRYQPPKSNIWGHSLRNMAPARQRALFGEFLKQAVAEYAFRDGILTIFAGPPPPHLEGQKPYGHATQSDVRHFEQLLGTVAQNGWFYSLPPEKCEVALNEIIRNSALIPGVSLLQDVGVSKWLIDGRPVAVQSTINLNYGMMPSISTFLQFETIEQFHFIKQVLADLRFCTLNEKHLKPIRRGKKTDDAETGNREA